MQVHLNTHLNLEHFNAHSNTAVTFSMHLHWSAFAIDDNNRTIDDNNR